MEKNKTKIPRRSGLCSRGGEPLLPGEYYYAALLWDEKSECYSRRDYCMTCWEREGRDECLRQKWSYWKAHSAEKVVEKKDLSHEEEVFETLKDALVSGAEGEAFLAALYLERKRLLTFRRELNDNGRSMRIYEDPKSEDFYCVAIPAISQKKM